MPDEAFDVAVIGGGSAGYVGAIRGAQLGLRVAVIEKEKLGGTCLHRGCIPTKSFLHSSELAHLLHGAGALGLKINGVEIDWPAVLKRKESVVNQLWRGTEFLMKKNKITVLKGEAEIESEHRVTVKESGEVVNAKNLLVASGSRPKSLPGLKMDGDRVINSDHAVSLDKMPGSIVIVGAGAVGTEFACVYNGYGADVTLIHTDPTGGFFNQLAQMEAIYGDVDTSRADTQYALGTYLLVQQQLNRDWYTGVRLDWTQNALDDKQEVWGVSPYVTWYWSEFLRFRMEYQHKAGDVATENTLFFQVTWVFGAHPPHPYWSMK